MVKIIHFLLLCYYAGKYSIFLFSCRISNRILWREDILRFPFLQVRVSKLFSWRPFVLVIWGPRPLIQSLKHTYTYTHTYFVHTIHKLKKGKVFCTSIEYRFVMPPLPIVDHQQSSRHHQVIPTSQFNQIFRHVWLTKRDYAVNICVPSRWYICALSQQLW